MSDTPLRDVRVPVHDVRHPVTRCSGARARCQTPRYAMFGCLCAMSDTPSHEPPRLLRGILLPLSFYKTGFLTDPACAPDQTAARALMIKHLGASIPFLAHFSLAPSRSSHRVGHGSHMNHFSKKPDDFDCRQTACHRLCRNARVKCGKTSTVRSSQRQQIQIGNSGWSERSRLQ